MKNNFVNNYNKINELTKKIDIYEVNKANDKYLGIIGISLFVYLLVFILISSNSMLINYIINLNIKNIQIIPTLMVGSSLLIGTSVIKTINFLTKKKDRLKQFSNAKKEKELIEEQARCKIERKRLIEENEIIRQSSLTVSNKDIFDMVSNNYSLTTMELEENIKSIGSLLAKENEMLGISIKRKCLADIFRKNRIKLNKIADILTFCMFGGVLVLSCWNIPFIILNEIVKTISFFEVVAPFFVGGIITGGYISKYYNDLNKVFKKLNNELGDNAIPKNEDYTEAKVLAEEIENISKEIVYLRLKLNEQQRLLELKYKIETKQKIKRNEQVDIKENFILYDENSILLKERGPRLVRKK